MSNLLLATLAAEGEVCRCGSLTSGDTGCCLDEEYFDGLCYKKCEVLTGGKLIHRAGPNTCCNYVHLRHCAVLLAADGEGSDCEGGVATDGGCAHVPCGRGQATAGDYRRKTVLGRWMYGLTFDIPTVDDPTQVVPIEGGTCTRLSFDSIQAKDMTVGDTSEISYELKGLRLHCQVRLSHGTLLMNLGVSPSTSVSFSLAVQPDRSIPGLDLPLGEVRLTKCAADAELSYLDFAGSSALIPGLKGMRDAIMNILHEHASSLVCQQIFPGIAQKATQGFTELADQVRPLLAARSLARSQPMDAGPGAAIDWSNYPPTKLVQALIDERTEAADDIVEKLPIVNLPLNASFSSSTGAMKVTVAMRALQVDGLRTLNTEGLRVGGAGEDFSMQAAFRRIRITLIARARVEPTEREVHSDDGPLEEDFSVSIDLSNASIGFRSLAHISREHLESLRVDQLQQLGCLAAAARTGRMSNAVPFQLEDALVQGMPTLQMVLFQGMYAGLADVVGTTAGAMLRNHAAAVESLLPGLLQKLRPKLDAEMSEMLDDAPECRPSATFQGPGPILSGAILWGSVLCVVAATAFAAGGPWRTAARRFWWRKPRISPCRSTARSLRQPSGRATASWVQRCCSSSSRTSAWAPSSTSSWRPAARR